MRARRIAAGLVVVAALVLTAADGYPSPSASDGQARNPQTMIQSTSAAPASPPPAVSSTVLSPGSSISEVPDSSDAPFSTPTTEVSEPSESLATQKSTDPKLVSESVKTVVTTVMATVTVTPKPPPDPIQAVPMPSEASSFLIVLHGKQVGDLPANVRVTDVPPEATEVVPPEPEGCPWNNVSEVKASDRIPNGCDWRNTSVYVKASGYPVAPSAGTTYIYGHACNFHLCPFSAIQRKADGSFTVQVGDPITVTTPTGVLTYRICGVGSSPKDGGAFVQPKCSSHIDLMVVTCEYEDGESLNNIVVAATLVKSRRL